jgi:hypothetical protein
MDAYWMIPAVVVIDTLMEHLGQRRDGRAQVPDSAMLTIAVVAATDVGGHHERAVQIMHGCGSRLGRISVARVHRRLHQRADWMAWIPANVGGASPRATGSLSIASPCQSAVACAPGAGGRCAGAHATGSARRNGRRSLNGVCIWSAVRMACPCAFRCCPQGCVWPARRGAAVGRYSLQQRG